MFTLAFESPEGTIGFTEANDLAIASKMIFRYAQKGYTLNAVHGTQTNDTSFVVQTSDNNLYTVSPTADTEEAINSWFTRLAHTLAFSDCSEEMVLFIMYKGKEIHYTGWKPGMLYEFADGKGNIIWSHSFPEWDH